MMKLVHPNVDSVGAAPSEAEAGSLSNGGVQTDYPSSGTELDTLVHAPVSVAKELAERTNYAWELEQARSRIGRLRRRLSICSQCKRIGDEWDNWQEVRGPGAKRWRTRLSHTICPDCYRSVVKPEVEQLYARLRRREAGRIGYTGSRQP